MEQLEDNLETFGKFQPLTELEEEAVEKAADLIRSRMKNGCTSCRYCMPCPFGVNIPEMFSIWNNCAMFDEAEKAKKTVQDAKQKLKTGLEVGSESPVSEYALELDNPWLYEEYLSKDLTTFMENYWKRNYLSGHWLSDHFPQRLYIGNSFCHLLFPKEDQLFQLLEKARKESLQVTLTFSYIREFMLENTGQLIEKLENWCEENKVILEIQVNDWAMAEMLKGKVLFVPVLGILLNKRRKDPRLHYKTETMAQIGAETESKFLEENSLNADFYRKYLEKEYGIVRYEWESCGYDMALPPGKNSLHLPFFQTNTSQYCTLYAV